MGRVGVRIGEKTIVILEDLSLQSTNLGDPISFVDNIVSYPDGIEITEGGNESTINLSAFGLQVTRRVGLQNVLVVNASSLTLDVCGLCGTLQGVLLYGDRRRVAAFGNRIEIEQFADSWRVNPSDQFLREERRDCSELFSMVYHGQLTYISNTLPKGVQRFMWMYPSGSIPINLHSR